MYYGTISSVSARLVRGGCIPPTATLSTMKENVDTAKSTLCEILEQPHLYEDEVKLFLEANKIALVNEPSSANFSGYKKNHPIIHQPSLTKYQYTILRGSHGNVYFYNSV